mgnify:CR=1 FL=1
MKSPLEKAVIISGLMLFLIFVAALSSCRTPPPYPENPVSESEAAVYQETLFGIYEGMDLDALVDLTGRSPLLRAHGANHLKLVFAFRVSPEESPGPLEAPPITYLSVTVDRVENRVVSWEEQ